MGRRRRVVEGCCCIIDVRGDVHPGRLSDTLTRMIAWMHRLSERSKTLGPGFEIPPPVILSACRSAERQREMQQAWDRGDTAGLAVRPVSDSKHVPDAFGVCHAVDFANDDKWLDSFGRVAPLYFPVEWGGTYFHRDPRHFEER